MKKIQIVKRKRDYGELGYRMFLAVLVGCIPILIIYAITNSITVDDCKLWLDENDVKKYDQCVEIFNSVIPTMKYASYGMGAVMFIVVCKGMIWEWKLGEEYRADRSPLKAGTITRTLNEELYKQKVAKQKQENYEIIKKYEEMDDLK